MIKESCRKTSAFTLAEIMICLAVIGIISIFWMSIASSRIDYGEKMGYWATVRNLQKGTNSLMGEGTTDALGHVISQLPSSANSGTAGFCNRLASTYNTINSSSSVDCTAKATTSSDFKTVKPNFTLSNGAVVYNLGSDPISSTNPIKSSSFLAFLFPENNANAKQIFVSALAEKQIALDADSGSGGFISTITKPVSDSVAAVEAAATEAGSTSSQAISSASNLIVPSSHLCDGTTKDDSTCSCLATMKRVYYSSTRTYDCEDEAISTNDYYCTVGTKRIITTASRKIYTDMGDRVPAEFINKWALDSASNSTVLNDTIFKDAPDFLNLLNTKDSISGCTNSTDMTTCSNFYKQVNVLLAQYNRIEYTLCADSPNMDQATCDLRTATAKKTFVTSLTSMYNLMQNISQCGPDSGGSGDSTTCPAGQFKNASGTCQPLCGGGTWVVQTHQCVCPSGHFLWQDHYCPTSCGAHESHPATSPICSCDSGYTKVNGTCTLTCGANQTLNSSGTCVCNSGYDMYNGNCVPACATNRGYIHTGSTGTCGCPSGQDSWNEFCVAACPSANAHHAGNAGTCVCDTGYEMVNGTCVLPCSAGQVRNSSGQCVALGPVCPDNASFNGSQCVCNSGYERYNGACVTACASNEERINGACVQKCGDNQTRNNGTCTCNSGYDMFKGVCLASCTNGKIRFADGSCQCNYGTDWVASANQCKTSCTGGQSRNASGDCVAAASYYDIFIDVDGLAKGRSVLNKDVFEFWVGLNGNIYPAPTSAMADNKDLLTARINYLDPHEKPLTLGTRYSYKEALCISNTVDDSLVSLGYCGNYKADYGHCHNGKNNNTCSVKLNLPGYQ